MEFRSNAHAFSILHDNVHHLHLFQVQAIRIFHHLLHVAVIGILIGLGTEGIHRRSLPQIQHAHLDGRLIGGNSHFSAQGIDFLHQVAFPRSSDGRVAGHHGHVFQGNGGEQGLTAQPGSRQGRFAARMACSHHNYIIGINEIHGILLSVVVPLWNTYPLYKSNTVII